MEVGSAGAATIGPGMWRSTKTDIGNNDEHDCGKAGKAGNTDLGTVRMWEMRARTTRAGARGVWAKGAVIHA